MGKRSGLHFILILISLTFFSCGGYIAERYKIIYDTPNIHWGSRMQMLVEDIEAIEDLIIETAQSFDLRKISVDEVRDKYFWLDPGVDIIFAYCNPTKDEYYNLIILYEVESKRRHHDLIIPLYTYWIDFFSYSKYGNETKELIALRDEFLRKFRDEFGNKSILPEEELKRPPRPIYAPNLAVEDSSSAPSHILRKGSIN